MGKIAVVFPGQGAQKTGMAKDFYEKSSLAKEIFEKASVRLDLDLPALCFEEDERLDQTEYTQAALLTTSIAMLKTVLAETSLTIDVTAGLSLGEYGSLVLNGAMDFEDAVYVLRKRGLFMQEAVPLNKGCMAAVLGMEASKIEEVLTNVENMQIANYNCPGQIVISGLKENLPQAMEKLKEAGAKRVLPLNVSGPFHSVFLTKAGEQLGEVLNQIDIHPFTIPYVTNVNAQYVKEALEVKPLLVKQVSSAVRWQQSVEAMLADGVDTFIEIGPGKTLTSFVKKINRKITTMNIEKWDDLSQLRAGENDAR